MTMNDHVQLDVSNLSKKFAQSLKRAMVYGMGEIGRASFGSAKERDRPKSATEVGLREGEFWALRDVNFQIRRGERVGIIGSNGAGKSTLFRLLSGIYEPTTGRICLRGRLQALIELGAGFHPMLTGRENIRINAAILGMRRRDLDARIASIIEFADIGTFIDAPVKNYSSGMLVRLGFAIAANMDPDIMLIDEVLAVGDAQFQSKCVGFTQKLADEGKTLVMVSHQLPQVLRICERVIWMRKGQVVMDGEAGDVVRHYSADAMQQLSHAKSSRDANHGSVLSEGLDFRYRVVEAAPEAVAGMRSTEYGSLPLVLQGSPLTVEIEYHLKQVISGQLSFWLHVKDAITGLRLFGTAGWFEKQLIPATPGQMGRVRIAFPDSPLMEGLYNIDLGVTDYTRAGESHGIASHNETNPSFVVVASHEGMWEPFRVMEGNRMPVIAVQAAWEHA
jgi:ABC-type polysaccharide/polyol phosphate transport system ATPase subunit